ncbi:MAG: SpoVG family protein [Acutalibacteraceae bacterium]|nr:SpoVG family protein [Acutalibacteraceae bacterium]
MAKKNEQKQSVPKITARIDRLVEQDDSSVKAYASVNIGGAFAVHGIKVIDSVKGTFISMPSNSYKKDGKMQYSDICHPITAEARNELIDKVTEAYEAKLSEEQVMDSLPEDEAQTADTQPSM